MNFKKKNAANAPAPNQAQQAARRRSLRSGAYASVLAVVVLVLVILLNLVVGAVPTKFTHFGPLCGRKQPFYLAAARPRAVPHLCTAV